MKCSWEACIFPRRFHNNSLCKIWGANRMNRPRSIYQYSNMAPRLSGQTSIFGVVFFVSKSLLGIERQRKLEKFSILTRKPRSHVRILIYRTWLIMGNLKIENFCHNIYFSPKGAWLVTQSTLPVPAPLNLSL